LVGFSPGKLFRIANRRSAGQPAANSASSCSLVKLSNGVCTWVFPAQTKSGHIEPSTLKKQHVKAIAEGTRILREETRKEDVQLAPFEFYTLRHTCLTRWAPHMDPWTLAYLAGHRDMNITKRYVHPQEQTIRAAMDRVRGEKGGHTSGHTAQKTDLEAMPVLTPNI
jgi:integrase